MDHDKSTDGASPGGVVTAATHPVEHALVIRYGRGILGIHRVDDATFEAARARYGAQGVIDLTATFGYYSLLACALKSSTPAKPPNRWAVRSSAQQTPFISAAALPLCWM